MAGGYDASGIYSRWFSWQDDAANGVKIVADRHDTEDNEFANALSLAILKDGRSVISADIPWNGRRITNLANPTGPQDAATLDYVQNLTGWPKSKSISGTDADGRLNFTGTSGVNGITWTYADVSWVARGAVASQESPRLVMNSSKTPPTTGTAGDVFIIDDAGRARFQSWANNLAYDGAAWRTPAAGTGNVLTQGSNTLTFQVVDPVTAAAYGAATLRTSLNYSGASGNSVLQLYKSASAKSAYIQSFTGTQSRWVLYLGDASAETAAAGNYTGSNFVLTGYDNTGATPRNCMLLSRDTRDVTFYGDVYSNSQFNATTTTAILSAASGGQIQFRPNGPTSSVEQMVLNTTGGLSLTPSAGTGLVVNKPTSGTGYTITAYGSANSIAVIGYCANTAYYGQLGFSSGANAYSFYGVGLAQNSTAWTVSDARAKENIVDVDAAGAYARVRGIPVKSYDKKQPDGGGIAEVGWLAQDIETVVPQAVMDAPIPDHDTATRQMVGGDTIKSTNDRTMLATLWAAFQHQATIIESLQAKVAALEAA